MLRRKGSDSGSTPSTIVGVDLYGDGRGGTGGTGDSRSPNEGEGLNQKEDLAGIDGCEPMAGCWRLGAFEWLAECAVEKEKAETKELRREPA